MSDTVIKKCSCGKEYPKSFSVGNRFRIKDFCDEYILCYTAGHALNVVQLTNLTTGNLFYGATKVVDLNNITEDEFKNLLGGFKLVCPDCLTEYKIVEMTYQIGQKFKNNGDTYVLCSFGHKKIGFININNGCRWGDGVFANDVCKITQDELNNLMDWGKFTMVEDD